MQGPETRHSLIGKLQDSAAAEAWQEFSELYRPLVMRVALAKGLQHDDAEDLAQDVLIRVSKAIDRFDPEADGSFRGWLFKVSRNLCVNQLTRGASSGRCGPVGSGDSDVHRLISEHPADEPTVTLYEQEHRRLRFQHHAQKLKATVQEKTWSAFWESTVEGRTIADVAESLQMSPGAVRVARCRVLAKLRESVGPEE